VLELHEGFVHGSVNCEDLHPALAVYAERVPHATVLLPDMKVVAKASFGFGDVNACIIFRKFENGDVRPGIKGKCSRRASRSSSRSRRTKMPSRASPSRRQSRKI